MYPNYLNYHTMYTKYLIFAYINVYELYKKSPIISDN